MGPRKLANLNKLVDQARSFDRAGIFALADFIEQLSRSVADEPKEPFAPIHPEKSNVVRLMTIHLSKGLEFPIVAVPDLDGGTRGDTASFRFTPTLGPMVRVPGAAGEESDSGGLALYRLQQDEEDEAETRRLMYVATTRAADYLILSSGVKKLGEPTGSWTQLLSRHFDLLSGDCLGPLPAGYDTPQIRVTQTEPPLAHVPTNERTWHDLTKLVDQLAASSPQNPERILPLVEPVPVDAAARRQFSFSQLTGLLEPETQATEEDRPLHYLQVPGGDDPLQFGTLVHAVLGGIDFAALGQGKQLDIRALVTRHAARQGIYGTQALAEAADLIEPFLATACAAGMQQSQQSFVELEFLLAWPPGSVEDNPPYLHGYIDRLWQDPVGDWHVLDFKTNRVTVENVGSTARKYERQMFLYGLAVEQIFGQAPKSAVLHFLRGGLEQSFTWNAEKRARMIDEITQAMQQLRVPLVTT
jgi:ATP-dependent helicase/nuclease subunit A